MLPRAVTDKEHSLGLELSGSRCTVHHIVFQAICKSVVSPLNVALFK